MVRDDGGDYFTYFGGAGDDCNYTNNINDINNKCKDNIIIYQHRRKPHSE